MLKKKYYDGIQVHSIITEELNNGELIMQILKRFADAPSANVRENVKGKWIDGSDERFVKCSKCGMETTRNELQGIALFGKEEPNYCPNCGARMVE